MPVVSVTRLRVRSWRYLAPFAFYAVRSSRQAKKSEGLIAVTLLREAHKTFWTLTVWTSEAAMKAFMLAGAHKKVMPRLMEWCDEASVVRWEQESSEAPGWLEAHRRMQADGRRSKVKHPSPAHERFEIPSPRVGGV